ncbi:hypothetical protein EG329_009388 [Mollisiaceae sp. DMI_Dod_QoI]|nr:hypothetical protein EG329_009388 [Helotiales sp. DMI_Dod_QoI]
MYTRTDESMPYGIWISKITSNPQGTFYHESTFRPVIISDEEARLLAEQDPSRSFLIDVFGKSLIGYAFETLLAMLVTAIICILLEECDICIAFKSGDQESGSEAVKK